MLHGNLTNQPNCDATALPPKKATILQYSTSYLELVSVPIQWQNHQNYFTCIKNMLG